MAREDGDAFPFSGCCTAAGTLVLLPLLQQKQRSKARSSSNSSNSNNSSNNSSNSSSNNSSSSSSGSRFRSSCFEVGLEFCFACIRDVFICMNLKKYSMPSMFLRGAPKLLPSAAPGAPRWPPLTRSKGAPQSSLL
ncbi:hypothetical protein Emed_007018 [Eimeria media]